MQALSRGTLVTWKQDKNFGFIRPDDGGKDVFVHSRDFGNIGRSPGVGDIVRYQRISDGKGRFRAADVQVDGLTQGRPEPKQRARAKKPASTSPVTNRSELPSPSRAWITVTVFACVLAGLVAFSPLPVVVPALYLVVSLIAFLLYAFDKAAAMNRRRRTRENTLLIFGLLGGWPGALVAQGMFRHKSSKAAFLVPFWITVVVNCACLIGASTEAGASAIRVLLY